MKKVVFLVAAMVFSATLFSCKSGDKEGDATTSDSTNVEKVDTAATNVEETAPVQEEAASTENTDAKAEKAAEVKKEEEEMVNSDEAITVKKPENTSTLEKNLETKKAEEDIVNDEENVKVNNRTGGFEIK